MGTLKFFEKGQRQLSLGLVALTFLALLLVPFTPVKAENGDPEGWRYAGLTFPQLLFATPNSLCFEGNLPGNLLIGSHNQSEWGAPGTYRYNWQSGQLSKISDLNFEGLSANCSPNLNFLYSYTGAATQTYIRFNANEPQGRPVQYEPTHFSSDGTPQIYSLRDGVLRASGDGGLNWQERKNPGNGFLDNITVSAVDGRAIYAVVADRPDPSVTKTRNYVIYFSPDAGQTWEQRGQGSATGIYFPPSFSFVPFKNTATPVNVLTLAINNGGTGESEGSTVYLSMDGGRNFTEAGKSGIFDSVQLVYSNEAVVRIKGSQSEDYTLSRTSDGKTWQPLTIPFTMARPPAKPQFNQAPGAPDNLFLSDFHNSGLWYSADGGLSWQKIGASNGIQVFVAPYLPLTLLGLKDNKLYALDLSDAGKSETKGVAATGAPGSRYYPETRHNLSGFFLKYWEEKGGLAQFGYPKTEAFREYNPADGKVYTVQYFERNRFEYHPENAGTQYEILLGLLGNQLTAQRKAAGEGAFNRFDNMHYPGGIYFAETGHNLRNSFKAYWEANGGLAIYGFPISEEFMEVNPDDGQTYVVQYFERNRFEYHPENKGTKYEVLLGLLGNSLLRQKGWL